MKLHYIITSALLLIAGFVQAAQGNKKQKTEGEQQGQTRQVLAPQQLTHEEQIAHNKLVAQALVEQKAHEKEQRAEYINAQQPRMLRLAVENALEEETKQARNDSIQRQATLDAQYKELAEQQQKQERVILTPEQVRDRELKRLAGIKRKNIDNALINDAWLAEVTTITIPELQKLIREYYINPLEYLSLVYPPSNLVQKELDNYNYQSIPQSSIVLDFPVNGGDYNAQINKQGMIWHSLNLYTADTSQKINFYDSISDVIGDEGFASTEWTSWLRNDNKIIVIPNESVVKEKYEQEKNQAFSAFILNADSSLYKQLLGHTDFISCVATNGDNITVTGSYDKTAKVWDADGKLLKTLNVDGKVTALAISDDGVIICGREDGVCRVWRSESGECYELSYQIMDESQYPITAITVHSGDRFITTSTYNRSKYFMLCTCNNNKQEVPNLSILPHDMYNVAFGLDGTLATASWKDKEQMSVLAIWNIDNPQAPKCLRFFEIGEDPGHIKITDDNSIICTTTDTRTSSILLLGFDGTITRYNLRSPDGILYNLGVDNTLYANIDGCQDFFIALKPDAQKLLQLQNLSFEQLATLRSLLKELYTNRVLSPQQEAVILSLWGSANMDLQYHYLDKLELFFDQLKLLFPILDDLKRRHININMSQEQIAALIALQQALKQKEGCHEEPTMQIREYHTQLQFLQTSLTHLLDMRLYTLSPEQIDLLLSLPQPLQETICQRFNLTVENLERLHKQNESKESKEQEQKRQ